MTEWQPEERRFCRPFSLVWLYDGHSSVARNDNQELASHLKSLPLLPHWTFGVDGDGDCMPRALVIGDVAGRMQRAPAYSPIWDAELALARDPVWGKVRQQDKKTEDAALARYRQASVTLHTSQRARLSQSIPQARCSQVFSFGFLPLFRFCDAAKSPLEPMSTIVTEQMRKPKSMPPIDEILTYASVFHAQDVRSASFDPHACGVAVGSHLPARCSRAGSHPT